jgi:hypothetical protein
MEPDALRPGAELTVGILRREQLAGAVKTVIGEIGGGRISGRIPRGVRDTERGICLPEDRVGFFRKPGRVSEFEDRAEAAASGMFDDGQKTGEPLRVGLEARGKLKQDGPEFCSQHSGVCQKSLPGRGGALEPEDVRDVPAGLHREKKVGGNIVEPSPVGLRFREMIEGVVDLDRREFPRVEGQPLVGGADLRRIVKAVPVAVGPARGADVEAPRDRLAFFRGSGRFNASRIDRI